MNFEVAITKRDANGTAIEGKVASEVSTMYVVARRDVLGEWETLFAERKATGERVELPSCFQLRPEAIVALDREAK